MVYFNPNQLVKTTNYRSPAYGRYGYVVEETGDTVKVEFADLPSLVRHNPNPDGRFMVFHVSAIEAVQGVPFASSYLLVTVLTLVGTQKYKRYAIAHVEEGQSAYDVAETIAANFFGSLGDWDGEFYLWKNTPCAAKLLDSKTITVARYAELRQTTPDYDLGADVKGTPF